MLLGIYCVTLFAVYFRLVLNKTCHAATVPDRPHYQLPSHSYQLQMQYFDRDAFVRLAGELLTRHQFTDFPCRRQL